MVDRIDPSLVVGTSKQDVDKFIESDFKIRSGMCPNDHGLMVTDRYGQSCEVCGFQTNKLPELTRQ